jgi:carbon-monoxide dehydrogenase large subunit
VQVDYAPLPAVADPFTSKRQSAAAADRESKTNHIFHWEVGDKEGTARALASAEANRGAHLVPAVSSGAAEPCGCVAFRRDGTAAVPRCRRRRTSIARRCRWSPASEDKIHDVTDRGGFGNKAPGLSQYVRHRWRSRSDDRSSGLRRGRRT